MVLPLLLVTAILTINAEIAFFRAEELHDAADAAMRASIVPCKTSLPKTGALQTVCVKNILDAVHGAAPFIPAISDSDAASCVPGPSTGPATDYFDCNAHGVEVCVRAEPTLYSPSVVKAKIVAQFSPLGPTALFQTTTTAIAISTTSATGVPGGTSSNSINCP